MQDFYNNNGLYYPISNKLKVFPCAWRDHGIDPEARLNSEKSLSNLGGQGGGNKSYISIANSSLSKATLTIVLNGYTFTLSNVNFSEFIAENTTVYAKIKLKSYNITSSAASERLGSFYSRSTGESENTTNDVLDVALDEIGTKYFTGLAFTTTTPTDTSSYIKIYENGKFVNRNILPINITNGKETGSIVLNSISNFSDEITKDVTNVASGEYAIASGYGTTASGEYAHTEGHKTTASGESSHSEGGKTTASGIESHAEGANTTASGDCAHAEGDTTTAFGNYSHAEGVGRIVNNAVTFGERSGNSVNPYTYTYISHSAGSVGSILKVSIENIDYYLCIESINTTGKQISFIALTSGFPADDLPNVTATLIEGIASGYYSHSEGRYTTASGESSHAEGYYTTASGSSSHAEGYYTVASGYYSHTEGWSTIASDYYSHAEGYFTTASGDCAHAEGHSTKASGDYSHAEGASTTASNNCSHAEGSSTTASGLNSHAEGTNTTASGSQSHAEGASTIASGEYSHTEGYNTKASKSCSHAEGYTTKAFGNYSHAEGYETEASSDYSHAEGYYTTASGSSSHAEGYNTTANHKSQHVFGEFNISDDSTASASDRGKYVEIVGNGTVSGRSNARTLDWSGNEVLAGHITCDRFSTNSDYKPAIDTAKAGIYIKGDNEINFSSSNNEILFGKTQYGKNVITTYRFYGNSNEVGGTIYAGSFHATSDARLKENIIEYKSERSILDLPVYKFDFITGTKNNIGCLAQDLQKICPEIVHEGNDGYLSIEENKIIYLLIDEVKKLKAEVEELKNENRK